MTKLLNQLKEAIEKDFHGDKYIVVDKKVYDRIIPIDMEEIKTFWRVLTNGST